MKKLLGLIVTSFTFSLVLSSAFGSAVSVNAAPLETLNVYNWEDYIYESDGSVDSEEDVIIQFEQYMANKGRIVKVNYETFSTNEDMYNQYQLGKGNYDVIAPSEYMILRMIREGMLQQLDYSKLPNYVQYASPYLQNKLSEVGVGLYAAGYMWGTLGIVYNPSAVKDEAKMHEDMKSWASLWDPAYKGLVSIKDSMRDTYLITLAYIYQEELLELKSRYETSNITSSEYNEAISEILNRTDDETLVKVAIALDELRANFFGLEVDSGKNDMVTGKIAMNTAWSGDAVYAMDTAEEETDTLLYFSNPLEGGNIWFDGWVIPKNAKNPDLAHEFINFISHPDIAVLNMDYIGYTPAIAGEAILEQTKLWYEVEVITEDSHLVDLTYFFTGTVSEDVEMSFYSDYVGRQLSAQYPSEEEITRCVIMKDFGEKDDDVIALWTSFKAQNLALWHIIVIIIAMLMLVAYLVFKAVKRRRSARHSRRAKAKLT